MQKCKYNNAASPLFLQSHVAGPSYAVILQDYDLQHCSLCMFLFFVVSNAKAITH